MKNYRIALFDSGVGGLSVLKVLDKTFDNTTFIYFGDNQNAPYGNKSQLELNKIAFNVITYLTLYNIDCVIFACNTLSLSTLRTMQKYFSIPILGVFPPVETSVLRGEKAVLLATSLTSTFYNGIKNLKVYPLPFLASDIEKSIFNLNQIDLHKHLYNIEGGFDRLILGCTHYNLIKSQICDHLKPPKVCDGVCNMVNRLLKILPLQKSLVKHKENSILFVGKNKKFNEKVWFEVVKN